MMLFLPCQDHLAHRLKSKFKNARKRSYSPCVVSVREAKQDKKRRTIGELPGHAPEVVRTRLEDEISMNAMLHDDAAQDVINSGLDATFPRRRQEVLGGTSVKKLKKLYPKLFDKDQVRNEHGVDISVRYMYK